MSETLIQEVVNLEDQLKAAEQKRDEIANAESVNQMAYEEAVSNYNMISNRLSEKRYELEQLQARQQITEQRIESDIPLAIAGVDFTQLPAEVIQLIERVVRADRRKFTEQHNEDMKDQDDKIKALRALNSDKEVLLQDALKQNATLHSDVNRLQEELDEEKVASADAIRLLNETKLRLNEVEKNRDNAAQQLEEKDKEIARLNSHIDDLREQLNRAPAPSTSIINIKPEVSEAAEMQNLVNVINKKYLVDVRPIGINWVEGTNPETGAKEVAHTSELAEPKPPEVQAVSDTSFRGESEENHTPESGNSGIHHPGVDAPPTSFPEAAEQTLDRRGDDGLVHLVSREEFEELRSDVNMLKRNYAVLALEVDERKAG